MCCEQGTRATSLRTNCTTLILCMKFNHHKKQGAFVEWQRALNTMVLTAKIMIKRPTIYAGVFCMKIGLFTIHTKDTYTACRSLLYECRSLYQSSPHHCQKYRIKNGGRKEIQISIQRLSMWLSKRISPLHR